MCGLAGLGGVAAASDRLDEMNWTTAAVVPTKRVDHVDADVAATPKPTRRKRAGVEFTDHLAQKTRTCCCSLPYEGWHRQGL